MAAPTGERDGDAFVIDFGDDENVTGNEWIDTMNALLDEAEAAASAGPLVLVTTGRGKHYSNGLDVAWMAGRTADDIADYVRRVEGVLARLLAFPAPTVAAVNGHAFGAGAFALVAHDHAVMRADRGYVCWPEVHLQMSFTPGLMAMVTHLLPVRTGWEAVVTGKRFAAVDAVAGGFVDRAVALDELMTAAGEIGAPLAATAGANLGRIKRQFHRPVLELLGT